MKPRNLDKQIECIIIDLDTGECLATKKYRGNITFGLAIKDPISRYFASFKRGITFHGRNLSLMINVSK